MDPTLFIEKADENFFCGVCAMILVKPQSCNQGHAFCASCIQQWLAKNRSCPECRDPMEIKKPIRCLLVEKMISKLNVRCSNACDDWTGSVAELEGHCKVCPLEKIPCNQAGCTQRVARKDLDFHKSQHEVVVCRHCEASCEKLAMADHLKVCDKVKVKCVHDGCGVTGTRAIVEQHMAEVCPFTLVACPHFEHGCFDRVARKDLTKHAEKEAVKHVSLLTAKFEELRSLSCLEDPYKAKVYWKVQNFSEKLMHRQKTTSEGVVKVGGFLRGLRVYHLGLMIQFNEDCLGVFIRPDKRGCCEMPLSIEELTIVLKAKPNSTSTNLSCTYSGRDQKINKVQCAMGWPSFVTLSELTAEYVWDDNTIEIEAMIKILPPITLARKSSTSNGFNPSVLTSTQHQIVHL